LRRRVRTLSFVRGQTDARDGAMQDFLYRLGRCRFGEVKHAIVNTMRAIPVGDPADPKIAVGPLVSRKRYMRVQSYIREGIEEGAEALVGAKDIRAASS
jgi:hypothetical protein